MVLHPGWLSHDLSNCNFLLDADYMLSTSGNQVGIILPHRQPQPSFCAAQENEVQRCEDLFGAGHVNTKIKSLAPGPFSPGGFADGNFGK